MKKIIVFAAVGALLAGCSDEVRNPEKPSNPGSDIAFQLNLQSDPQTRTLYGEETNNAFPIYWVDQDQIIVASPQCAAGRNNALYQVTVPNATSHTATAVTKVNEAGVQWGDKLPANFYSVYPVAYNSSASNVVRNEIVNGTDNAVAHLNVRNYQTNIFTKENGKWVGTPIDRKSMTDLSANLKNPDALMYAQTRQTTDGNVQLTFKPFTVAFNVTLQGYTVTEALGTDPTVTIQEVAITAPEGTQLVGNFDATFNADGTSDPQVNTNVNTLSEPNVIHIPTLSTVDGHYLTISQNESVTFNVFAIPTNKTIGSDWTLTVRTTSGTFTRALTPGSGNGAANLIAGQMHKLNMPTFQVANTFQFNQSSWIAQIPRNVYLSELSIPGAWYASQSEYQGSVTYASLWSAGVRAFGIETRSSVPTRFEDTRNHVVVSGTGDNSGNITGNKYVGGTPIVNVMRELITQLQSHTNEYALLVLSYADGGSGGHNAEDYSYWLQGIYNEYNALTTTEKGYVYSDAITPNTTVGDVVGKLIIKVNVGGNLPGGNITLGDYAGNLPGLLSYTDIKWENSTANSSLISNLYWGSWSNDYMTNVSGTVESLDPNSLYWNYTVANRTSTASGAGIPSYANRQGSITTILANSRAIYEAGHQNMWFFVGAGGTQATSSTSRNPSATAFASTMNKWINDKLVEKINGEDFSPFGIVMCNYITDATYTGPTIIENIIKMNRLFRLNRDESQPEWPGTTQQNSPANYSSFHTMAGNAWTVNQ